MQAGVQSLSNVPYKITQCFISFVERIFKILFQLKMCNELSKADTKGIMEVDKWNEQHPEIATLYL